MSEELRQFIQKANRELIEQQQARQDEEKRAAEADKQRRLDEFKRVFTSCLGEDVLKSFEAVSFSFQRVPMATLVAGHLTFVAQLIDGSRPLIDLRTKGAGEDDLTMLQADLLDRDAKNVMLRAIGIELGWM